MREHRRLEARAVADVDAAPTAEEHERSGMASTVRSSTLRARHVRKEKDRLEAVSIFQVRAGSCPTSVTSRSSSTGHVVRTSRRSAGSTSAVDCITWGSDAALLMRSMSSKQTSSVTVQHPPDLPDHSRPMSPVDQAEHDDLHVVPGDPGPARRPARRRPRAAPSGDVHPAEVARLGGHVEVEHASGTTKDAHGFASYERTASATTSMPRRFSWPAVTVPTPASRVTQQGVQEVCTTSRGQQRTDHPGLRPRRWRPWPASSAVQGTVISSLPPRPAPGPGAARRRRGQSPRAVLRPPTSRKAS